MAVRPRFTIIHIPHSSTVIPVDDLPDFVLSPEELKSELLKMTDHYTDELFGIDSTNASIVRFPLSRLVVDPERFADDEQEIIAQFGMGVVYTKAADLKPLRATELHMREMLIERYYRPHHKRLNDLCRDALREIGFCLIIDGHSFPSIPLPYELDQSPDRPQICIGTDDFH